jgi:hypothetical protein
VRDADLKRRALRTRFVVSGIHAGAPRRGQRRRYRGCPVSRRRRSCSRKGGASLLKFFPAEAAGGTRALRAFASVFPEVGFCPTGGVTAENVRSYLELPNVVCVGGTWLAPPALMAAQQWATIQELATRAVELARAA